MLSTTHSVSPSEVAPQTSPPSGPGGGPQKPNENKGELRIKRKKARRACFSCQRAHLTCADERPCARCVSRGIGDGCQDGVRKKAKYLNDGDSPTPMNISHMESLHVPPMRQVRPQQQHQQSATQQPRLYDPDQSMEEKRPMHINSQQRSEMYSDDPTAGTWYAPLALHDMNGTFKSSYAHGEFAGMTHIAGQHPRSAGGVTTPDNLSVSGFSPSQQNFITLNSDPLVDWPGHSRSNSTGAGMGGNPHGYAVAAGPGSIATPSPEAGSPQTGQSQQASIYNTMSGSPRNSNGSAFHRQSHQQQLDQTDRQKGPSYPQVQHHSHNIHNHPSHLQQQAQPRRRNPPMDPSSVYHTVTEPYSYVQAYHRLFAMVETRFTKKQQLRLARAFSAFRPSFIASIQKLTRDDLVFQEKCCQRAILIYESSLPHIGTPTLVCRRSGEVVMVGKEFCMLSGWPKEVLLGEKPNLNTNVPHAKDDEELANRAQQMRQRLQMQLTNGMGREEVKGGDEDGSGAERSAPRPKPSGPSSVFLLELMDDESVCEFYEKFSQAAFADSTAKIRAKCKILKYKPTPTPAPVARNDEEENDDEEEDANVTGMKSRRNGNDPKMNGKRPNDILGSATTIECMMAWTLRRDTFDIPMLIVMNFLPILATPSTSNTSYSSSLNTRESDNGNKHQRGGGSSGGHPGGMQGNNKSPMMKMGGSELVPVR